MTRARPNGRVRSHGPVGHSIFFSYEPDISAVRRRSKAKQELAYQLLHPPILRRITVDNTVRGASRLERPLFGTHHSPSSTAAGFGFLSSRRGPSSSLTVFRFLLFFLSFLPSPLSTSPPGPREDEA